MDISSQQKLAGPCRNHCSRDKLQSLCFLSLKEIINVLSAKCLGWFVKKNCASDGQGWGRGHWVCPVCHCFRLIGLIDQHRIVCKKTLLLPFLAFNYHFSVLLPIQGTQVLITFMGRKNLTRCHLHSSHNSIERTSQEQTELSFYREVLNSRRLWLAHVVQTHIWVDPLQPRSLSPAWIENSSLLCHPTFDLYFLDYVRAPCLVEEHFSPRCLMKKQRLYKVDIMPL